MDRERELAAIRRAYAREVMAEAGVHDERLEAAFASVKREDFLGPGPWYVVDWRDGYTLTPDADPTPLYTDSVVAILPERHVNNGQPSLHARMLAAAAPKQGEHVVHVGTGGGYYTAIMARLVDPSGRVTGIELDPVLALRSKSNLAPFANARVVEGDGTTAAFDDADIIYVNAGATRPADAWLDRLTEGGRLILPLTTDKGFIHNRSPVPIDRRGAVFRIERRTPDFLARWVSPVAIIPCEGGRDAASETSLAEAFLTGDPRRVTRLYRSNDVPAERCWLRAPGWCLAYE